MGESHVEQQVAARIAAAKRRAEEQQRVRGELAAARAAGLVARHRRKLKHFAERGLALAPLIDNSTPAVSGG